MSRWDAFTREELKSIYGGLCANRPYLYARGFLDDYREGMKLIAEIRPLDPLGSDAEAD